MDGVEYNDKIDDHRIIYYSINKLGNDINGAGLVRNKGIEIASTPWVCFLDDDDTFTPDYINNDYSLRFKNSSIEDFMMLKRCEDNLAKIHYSEFITYNVRHGFI